MGHRKSDRGGIFKKNAILLGVVVLFLAAMPACDSSSSGGGGGITPATGYTQADLAGTWALRGLGFGRATIKIDDQGQVVWWNNGTNKWVGFFERITVAADGQLSGKATIQLHPGIFEVIVFNGMRFKAKSLVTGAIVDYQYTSATGKDLMQSYNVWMTRYDR